MKSYLKKMAAAIALCLIAGAMNAQNFKVGTYNIFTSYARRNVIAKDSTVSHQRYWCNSAQAVAEMISELDCDILGLQEVCDSIWGLKGDKDIRNLLSANGRVEYDWILYPNTKSGKISYDVAIAYKNALFDVCESGIFFLGGVRDTAALAHDAPKGSQRPCVWAHMIHKPSGKEFYFLSTHFKVPDKTSDGKSDVSANKYNMQKLREIAVDLIPQDMPSILVGDLNADNKSKHWGTFGNSRWFDLFQHYSAAGRYKAIVEGGTQNVKNETSLSHWKPDHICLHGFRPLNMDVVKSRFATADGTLHYPSDHLPVVADVAFCEIVDKGIYNTPPPVNAKTIRVVSSNIRFMNNHEDKENGWDRRKSAFVSMIHDVKPAVIGFQECCSQQRDYLLERCSGYACVDYLIRRNETDLKPYAAFVDPVLWDTKVLELLEWDAFYLSETPEECSMSWDAVEPRTALWCHFKHIPTGKEFIFINTHLDHKGKESRKKGLDVIIEKLSKINPKGLPMVTIGDFNAQYKAEALDRVKKEWKDARVEAKSSDDKYSFNGFGKSWNGTVDYIWYKGFKRCHDYKVIVRKYNHVPFISDHYPIRADIEF